MKNKKNGFTLVEVLGILILLAILVLIVTTVITKNIKDSKQRMYEQQLETIKLAAKNYMIDNVEDLPKNVYNTKSIKLNTLKLLGYVDNNMIDPITGMCFDNEKTVVNVSKNGDIYDYSVDAQIGDSKKCDVHKREDPEDEEAIKQPVITIEANALVIGNGESVTFKVISNYPITADSITLNHNSLSDFNRNLPSTVARYDEVSVEYRGEYKLEYVVIGGLDYEDIWITVEEGAITLEESGLKSEIVESEKVIVDSGAPNITLIGADTRCKSGLCDPNDEYYNMYFLDDSYIKGVYSADYNITLQIEEAHGFIVYEEWPESNSEFVVYTTGMNLKNGSSYELNVEEDFGYAANVYYFPSNYPRLTLEEKTLIGESYKVALTFGEYAPEEMKLKRINSVYNNGYMEYTLTTSVDKKIYDASNCAYLLTNSYFHRGYTLSGSATQICANKSATELTYYGKQYIMNNSETNNYGITVNHFSADTYFINISQADNYLYSYRVCDFNNNCVKLTDDKVVYSEKINRNDISTETISGEKVVRIRNKYNDFRKPNINIDSFKSGGQLKQYIRDYDERTGNSAVSGVKDYIVVATKGTLQLPVVGSAEKIPFKDWIIGFYNQNLSLDVIKTGLDKFSDVYVFSEDVKNYTHGQILNKANEELDLTTSNYCVGKYEIYYIAVDNAENIEIVKEQVSNDCSIETGASMVFATKGAYLNTEVLKNEIIEAYNKNKKMDDIQLVLNNYVDVYVFSIAEIKDKDISEILQLADDKLHVTENNYLNNGIGCVLEFYVYFIKVEDDGTISVNIETQPVACPDTYIPPSPTPDSGYIPEPDSSSSRDYTGGCDWVCEGRKTQKEVSKVYSETQCSMYALGDMCMYNASQEQQEIINDFISRCYSSSNCSASFGPSGNLIVQDTKTGNEAGFSMNHVGTENYIETPPTY